MSHYSVKVYDSDEGFERETIRGLTHAQMHTVMTVFDREGIQAQSMKYDDEGKFVHGEGMSVNWDGGIDRDKLAEAYRDANSGEEGADRREITESSQE